MLWESNLASSLQCPRQAQSWFSLLPVALLQIGNYAWLLVFSDDFTKIPNRVGVYSMDASYVGISSVQNCADICRDIGSSFTCMSFDYCPSTQLCQLSKTRTPDGNMLNQSTSCDHYSSKPLSLWLELDYTTIFWHLTSFSTKRCTSTSLI